MATALDIAVTMVALGGLLWLGAVAVRHFTH